MILYTKTFLLSREERSSYKNKQKTGGFRFSGGFSTKEGVGLNFVYGNFYFFRTLSRSAT